MPKCVDEDLNAVTHSLVTVASGRASGLLKHHASNLQTFSFGKPAANPYHPYPGKPWNDCKMAVSDALGSYCFPLCSFCGMWNIDTVFNADLARRCATPLVTADYKADSSSVVNLPWLQFVCDLYWFSIHCHVWNVLSVNNNNNNNNRK